MRGLGWISVASFAAMALANINEENSISTAQKAVDDVKTFTYSESHTVTVTGRSTYYQDSGEQRLRLTFDLINYQIKANQVYEFLLKYTTTKDPIVDPVNLLY